MFSPAHLLIAPILIPLIAGAITLLHDERQRGLKLGVGLTSSTLQLIVAAMLIDRASHGIDGQAEDAVLYLLDSPYHAGNNLVINGGRHLKRLSGQ